MSTHIMSSKRHQVYAYQKKTFGNTKKCCTENETAFIDLVQASAAVIPVTVAPCVASNLCVTSFLSLSIVGPTIVVGSIIGSRIALKCWTAVSRVDEPVDQDRIYPENLEGVSFTQISHQDPVYPLAEDIGCAIISDLHGVRESELGTITIIDSISLAITQSEVGTAIYHLKIQYLDFLPNELSFPLLTVLPIPYIANFFTTSIYPYLLTLLETLPTDNTNRSSSVLTAFSAVWPVLGLTVKTCYTSLRLTGIDQTGRGCQLGFLYLTMQDPGMASLLYSLRTFEGMSPEDLSNFFRTVHLNTNPYELPRPED